MIEKATFAAGCFWGVEAAFRKLEGVQSTRVGYTGGTVPNPTYHQVGSGETGHAEAVEILFNPEEIPFEKLLDTFWGLHNPSIARQGPNGRPYPYRAAIFYHTAAQEKAAQESRDKLERSGRFQAPITTQILPANSFYPAEERHQQYYEKQSRKPD